MGSQDPEAMTDDEIEALFARLRWPPAGTPICPKCGIGETYRVSKNGGRVFRCKTRTCRTDITLLGGTALTASKIPLRRIYLGAVAYCARRSWRNGMELARAMGASHKAGWLLSCRFDRLVLDGEEVTADELISRALAAPPAPHRYDMGERNSKRNAPYKRWWSD